MLKRATFTSVFLLVLAACSTATPDTTDFASGSNAPTSTPIASTTATTTEAASTTLSADGPSQSVADASRDGVLPELAELPLSIRSEPVVTVETAEGTWVLSYLSDQLSPSMLVGDTNGNYGTDFVATSEYGELLLVADAGQIARAYPMTGFPPSWLLVDDDAVYVGRVGDGGLPWSVIGRIDRRVLEAEFIMFPAADVEYDYWPEGWRFVPEDYDVPLVAMDISPSDSFIAAESWIGTVHVNLEELERLFAGAES